MRKNEILIGFALLVAGCDQRWQVGPTAPKVTETSAPAMLRLALTPDELVLNVLSNEPCPCPYDSTGSFQVAGLDGSPAAWRVTDNGVAEVRPDGVVTAVATGTTLIRLDAGTQSATASITVLDRGGRAAVVVR